MTHVVRRPGRARVPAAAWLAALWLAAAPAPRAQFAALDWQLDGTCGSGSLTGEVMHVVGCDDGPFSGEAVFFQATAPYAGTVFTRVDFFNHDVFWGVDWTAWTVDGAVDMLHHNYEVWLGSLVFDAPASALVGLGVSSLDNEFGPGEEHLTAFRFFPDGVTQRHAGDEAGADFGAALASAGDVDGDGVPDLLVGAPLAGGGTGRVRLLSGADGSVLLDLPGPTAGGAFGAAVDAPGDVDGDGVPDLFIGAPLDGTAGEEAGAAYLLSGADGTTLRVLLGDAPFDHLGASVAGPGDADGDGVPDLAVGAPLNDQAGNKAGLVRAVSGGDGTVLFELTGSADRDELGRIVARAGDADGDGLADLALGTPLADVGDVNIGEVRLVSGLDGTTIRSWTGALENERFGSSVSGPGDVDGDGLGDVLVGSPDAAAQQARLLATSDGLVLQQWDLTDWVDQGHHYGPLEPTFVARFGDVVAGAGDLDDDGVPDVLVRGIQRDYTSGAALSDEHVLVFAFSGRDGGLLEVFAGTPGNGRYGDSLAAAGDLDGDGRGDVLVGDPDDGAGTGAVETITTRIVWADLGFGLAGTAGVPTLSGQGLLAPGTPVGLSLSGAAPSASSILVVGATAVMLPFAGGTLVPAFEPPAGVLVPLVTDGAGGWSLSGPLPGGLPPGTSLWMQAWTADAGAPFGRSACGALRATVP